MTNLRIGHGFDVHRLVPGRKLIIGGVDIPCERGLDGHSDADVLLHAVMDALLGAAGLPDIGQQFPPSDESYRGADSMNLLSAVVSLIKKAGVEGIVNIDAVIMAESPKMNPHIQQMIGNIARVLAISPGRINIKATTTEKLGYVGRGEGIAASAVCLLEKDA